MHIAVISICTKDSHCLDPAAKELNQEGYDIELTCADSVDLDADPILLNKTAELLPSVDLIFLRVHGDVTFFKKFDKIRDIIDENNKIAFLSCTEEWVMDEHRYMFRDLDDYDLVNTFVTLGGNDNHKALLKWAMRTIDGVDVDIPEPIIPPAQGAYHPSKGTMSIEEMIDTLDHDRPTVAVMFYQKQFITNNLKGIDALVMALERKGVNALPIFLYTMENKIAGAIGVKNILDRHLTKNGKPLVDCIIETMSFSQTLIANPGDGEQVPDDPFFERFGVPVIQTTTLMSSEEAWRDNIFGLSSAEIAFDIVHPEFDGQIITIPFSCTEIDKNGGRYNSPIDSRIDDLSEIAYRWSSLRRKSNSEKKVAILLYMYPPQTDRAGGAAGLDTFQSTVDLLKELKAEGYKVDWIPENSRELVDRLLDGLTLDTSWSSEERVLETAIDMMTKEEYIEWTSDLSNSAKDRIERSWGPPPGEVHVTKGKINIPGILNGNITIGFQPDRGHDIQSDYHDTSAVMPHQYLAYYRWLKEDFKVDAIIHVGTHGTLEWLPGKSVGLSEDCCPDYVLKNVPDIYPYIIGNPGEGIQAKRRAAAVIIDHMIPAMCRAGSYDDISELESVLQIYMSADSYRQEDKRHLIEEKLHEVVMRMSIFSDIGLSSEATPEEVGKKADDLYDYVIEVKGALIKDGMHILGTPPSDERLEEMIYSLTRFNNGDIPSLRESIGNGMGLSFRDLTESTSEFNTEHNKLNGQLVDDIEHMVADVISKFLELDFDRSKCIEFIGNIVSDPNDDLIRITSFICDELYPNIIKIRQEMDSLLDALNGDFIPPGPSGCPTRGRAQILPTGRNFYSIDPDAVPWHSSWEIGREMADQMIERYIEENGTYPQNIGVVLWATDTMKTGGDDVAYILWLMGVRPVWTGYGGRVKGLEVVPLEELGRPRLDVTVRISGLFRDTFPNITHLMDDAVDMVSELEESDEENYLLANLRSEVAQKIAEGLTEDDALAVSKIRIFGDPPGAYGTGVDILIRTSDWSDIKDLGDIYQSYGCHVYGKGRKGEKMPELFRTRLSKMQVTVKNSVSREYDMFDNDDVYIFLGGLNAAVTSVSGSRPMSFIGDSSDTSKVKTKTIEEESKFIFRSKILNPKWLNGLKQHGFKGAQEVSEMFEYVFAWDATSDIIEPWMYESMAETYIFNEENRDWIEDVNPFAMREMIQQLLEAVERGMWEPSKETMDKLSELFVLNEEILEEITDR